MSVIVVVQLVVSILIPTLVSERLNCDRLPANIEKLTHSPTLQDSISMIVTVLWPKFCGMVKRLVFVWLAQSLSHRVIKGKHCSSEHGSCQGIIGTIADI